jgi:hypothetical protein
MSEEITTAAKLVGGLLAILSMPFAWMHTRQNRVEDALVSMTDSIKTISENVAAGQAHQEHIRNDIAELKESFKQRRKNDTP